MAPTSADFEAQPALAEMPAQVTFKLSLRRDLRRWTPPVCLTYEAFVHGIQAAYELGPDCDLNLTYTDADGDQVRSAATRAPFFQLTSRYYYVYVSRHQDNPHVLDYSSVACSTLVNRINAIKIFTMSSYILLTPLLIS